MTLERQGRHKRRTRGDGYDNRRSGAFAGQWELGANIPGAEDVRGQVAFDMMGEVLVQRTTVPASQAPDSCCVVVSKDGRFTQHYFDARGVARLYEMTFEGRTWTLERTKSDFTPLDFGQRYVGAFDDDRTPITGEWQSSSDGLEWSRDFGLIYRRVGGERTDMNQ